MILRLSASACLFLHVLAFACASANAQEIKLFGQTIDVGSLSEGAAGDDETDRMRLLQSEAFATQKPSFGRWGHIQDRYSTWVNHSNRLIPVYTFGIELDEWRSDGSPYSDPERLKEIYGLVPDGTLNPTATYFDQTDIHRLQIRAVELGYKNIIVMVFDGMDWQTTRCAAMYKTGEVQYQRGRGTGIAFQDYRGIKTDFGLVCTSSLLSGAKTDVNSQTVLNAKDKSTGGYDPLRGGRDPWHEKPNHDYLIGLDRERPHTVTDSAASATALFSGRKTYNGSINMSSTGERLVPIARRLQSEEGFRVGVVTSVPVSHATIGGAYANNVTRKDYQDIARDLVGLPSSSHRREPLDGLDVLLGGGWGETKEADTIQGDNYLPGNSYFHEEDLQRCKIENGGRYTVAERTTGMSGRDVLMAATEKASAQNTRLLGLFGVKGGHLPFQTADGGFNPTLDVRGAEKYSQADVEENPTLADLTRAALRILHRKDSRFWLMIEAGDVDWANHSNNLDNSIGAVFSGEDAFTAVINWATESNLWNETALIVTSDHGHYFVIDDPSMIANASRSREHPKDAKQIKN